MNAGCEFPPIVVDRKNRLVCGHTRYAAYKRAFNDPEYAVPCTVTDKTRDIDLVIEAARDNARHGHPLNSFDKKNILLKLRRHKISEKEISEILGITIDRVEKWGGMVVYVKEPSGKKEARSIKRGNESMIGQTVTLAEYEDHAKTDLGVSVEFHAKKIINVLSRGVDYQWVSRDEETLLTMKILHDTLGKFLARVAKSA
jgi:hypothetical protein